MMHAFVANGRMILLLALLVPVIAVAQDRGNPESRFVRQFVPWGTLQAPAMQCDSAKQGFGQYVYPVGDVNHDGIADWLATRVRCDTFVDYFQYQLYPLELILFKGVRGGLPSPESGSRIVGTTDVGETRFLASGDWNGDHNRDLAVNCEIFKDTSDGNFVGGYDLHSLIIFWGNESGTYDIHDTSHLPCRKDKWRGIGSVLSTDFNNDGVDDLLVWGGGYLENGVLKSTATVLVFQGHKNGKWGDRDIPRTADIQWWNVPPFNYLQLTDQDCDGYKDVAFIYQSTNYHSYVSIIYGKPGVLLDTTNIEKLDMTSSGAHYALFSDVTGDGVPELTANCDGEKLEVFAGKPGQRLVEQYGSGNDAKNGRPWAEVWLPRRIHDGWSGAGGSPLYDMGDLGRDGVSDLWTYSWPFVIGYIGGKALDSSIDAEFDTRGYGDFAGITRLGDIDGSGLSSFAITFASNPGSIMFFKPLDSLPVNGNVRRTLPHPVGFRCEHAAGVEQQVAPDEDKFWLSNRSRPGPE